jgi:hypothetical protein
MFLAGTCDVGEKSAILPSKMSLGSFKLDHDEIMSFPSLDHLSTARKVSLDSIPRS